MNRRFSKALALLMAVSLCTTPAFAGSVTYNLNGATGTAPTDNKTDYDSGVSFSFTSEKPTREGYKFLGWNTDKDATTALDGFVFKDSGDQTFYAIWQKETAAEATVTGIAVKSQPTKTSYTVGDKLDLTGLTVTLTMSDKTTKEVALADFETNKITVFPANGAVLTAEHKTVSLTVEGVDTPATITITVHPKAEVEIKDETLKEQLPADEVTIGATVDKGDKIVINTAEKETTINNDLKAAEEAVAALPETATAEEVKDELGKTFDVSNAPAIQKINTSTKFTFSIEVQDADGKTKDHSGTVSVEIPLPSMFQNAKNLLAIHYHGNKPRILPTIIKNGKVSFTLTGLSDVALVEYTPADSGSEDPQPPVDDNKPGSSNDRYVAYNPGGSSGGSGGGGGGSSSKKGGSSMFNQLTNTINGILKSQLSKGTVGAASAVTGTAAASISTPATQASATRAISQAVSKARANGSNSAEAIMQNVSVVSASILESMASEARKSGVNAYLSVNTMKNGIVDVRVRIPVSAAARLGRDVNMASVDNTAVKTRFNRYYSNRLDVVALAQNGSFGVPASVAARLALGNANAADLHFYSFNAATNSYQEMVQTGAFIDVNGYLHFNTELGGYIVISVGALELK
ncbi:MAG: hypothetical protein HFG17_04875 [Oscillospiraceae bacterium]|nr:hypothetical protein [Oscillospiraceae bacterium]